MRLFLVTILSLLFISSIFTGCRHHAENPDITVAELRQHIDFLASDSLEGRKSGTPQSLIAAEYIKDEFVKSGLKLLDEDGFLYFDLVTDVAAGDNNYLDVEGESFVYDKDFSVYSFSENTEVSAQVVFVGYGLEIESDKLNWNDYHNINVKNKWVLVLKGDPESASDDSDFINYSNDRQKILSARDHEAAGVIFTSGPEFDSDDKLVSLYYDKTHSSAGLPVLNVKRSVADKILEPSSRTVDELEKEINETMIPLSFPVSTTVNAGTEILKEKVQDQNVAAMIKAGNTDRIQKYIIIGAHYDHLGMGGPGSNSRMPDTIAPHNGADDNASGVAGIIEIAEKLKTVEDKLNKNIIVVAFGAEEMGLIGSSKFTENPPVGLDHVYAMVNFDMIGRLDSNKKSLAISGTGTALEFDSLLKKISDQYQLNPTFSPEGYGPSDHAAFYASDIPVLFISSGAHKDYHTPFDDIEFINFVGQKEIADFSYDLIYELATDANQLTFQEAGPKRGKNYRGKLKVTLGIMPDFTSDADNGLGVGGGTKGRPADKAGMEKGDLISAINGKPVNNIYDYMNRLKKLEPGQIITVDIIRGEEKKVLIVQLD